MHFARSTQMMSVSIQERYQRVNDKLQYVNSLKLLASNLISSLERSNLRNFRFNYQFDAQATMLSRQTSLREFARKLYAIEKFATRLCLTCDIERVTLKFALDMRVVLQSHKIHDTSSRDWESSHENEFNCSKSFQAFYLLHQRMLEKFAIKLAWCTTLREFALKLYWMHIVVRACTKVLFVDVSWFALLKKFARESHMIQDVCATRHRANVVRKYWKLEINFRLAQLARTWFMCSI